MNSLVPDTNWMRQTWMTGLVSACLYLGGCASYVTPGRGVSMTSLAGADADIKERMTREPTAPFPARMAVVRVQAPEYRSDKTESYGRGAYSVVTTRDFERDEHWQRLAKLPQVTAIAPLNRLVIPTDLHTDKELRLAAASVKADLLLVYSVDTVFRIHEHDLGPLQLVSLGMAPTTETKVTATVSAALFDVRTGYVYGLTESTAQSNWLASAWTRQSAMDDARQRAERKAFEKLLDEFEGTWAGVVKEYDTANGRTNELSSTGEASIVTATGQSPSP